MRVEHLLRLLIFIGCFLGITSHVYLVSAEVDDYPNKTIECVIFTSAGGGADISTRIFTPYLAKELGVTVVVENRPGAGSEVGTTYLYKAKPDGYTILVSDITSHILTCVAGTPIYKYEDIITMAVPLIEKRILLVRKDSRLNSLIDFIEEAKRNPGKMSVGVTQASGQQLLALYLRKSLNLNFAIVPFRGGVDVATAMLGGHIDVAGWGDALGRYTVREMARCIGIGDTKPHVLWPEGQPINEQLKRYQASIPNMPRVQVICVRAEFKKQYPERYKKLRNAILNASKNPDYLELERKQKLDSIRVWGPGENFEKDFNMEYEFVQNNKDLLKDM